MNSDPVQDYILEDEKNLHTAAAVFNAWPEVRKQLVSSFLNRLQSRLEDKLKEWEFDRWGHPFSDSSAGVYFWKQGWKEEYYVCLSFADHGEEVAFGLGRDEDQRPVQTRRHCDGLLPAVKETYTSARDRNYWEARVVMPSPTPSDWRKPEVLWRMRDGNDEFLNEVAAHLLKVAEISGPIVDRFVDGLARKK